jgi:hypothetical protein
VTFIDSCNVSIVDSGKVSIVDSFYCVHC